MDGGGDALQGVVAAVVGKVQIPDLEKNFSLRLGGCRGLGFIPASQLLLLGIAALLGAFKK
jgi:hypothetical protein